jgi:RNAse (barnase) inhibitor barstar
MAANVESVYYTSAITSQDRITLRDGSPCNDTGTDIEVISTASNAKRDYTTSNNNYSDNSNVFANTSSIELYAELKDSVYYSKIEHLLNDFANSFVQSTDDSAISNYYVSNSNTSTTNTIITYTSSNTTTTYTSTTSATTTTYANSIITNTNNYTLSNSIISDTSNINATVYSHYKSSNTFSNDYPYLYDRISSNILITPIEVAEFEVTYFVSNYSDVYSNNSILLIEDLNDYYNTTSSYYSTSKSYCDLILDAFDKAKAYYDAVEDSLDFIESASSALSKLADMTLAEIANKIMNAALNIIEKVFDRYKRIIKNLVIDFIDTIEYIHSSIANKYRRLKTVADKIVSDTNKNQTKNQVKGIFGKALSIFEDPTYDEVRYLIQRICYLIENFQTVFEETVMDPLYEYRDHFKETYKTLKSRSEFNTAVAVAAGAKRYDPSVRYDNSQQGYYIARMQAGAQSVTIPPSSKEINNIPKWDTIKYNVDGSDILVLSPAISGDKYIPGVNMGREGWDRCTTEAVVSLLRLQKYFSDAVGYNVKLHINSAFRSPEYQLAIRNNGNTGAAKNSNHMRGTAFDISITSPGFPGTSYISTFIRCAKEAGFKGFGYYDTFIHVDLGPSRTWKG